MGENVPYSPMASGLWFGKTELSFNSWWLCNHVSFLKDYRHSLQA
ncbi:MarRP [Salmonella phage 19]|nr:MarRP [Salmonella phage 19]